MKEKALWLALGVIAGVVFAPQISKLPLLSKLPTV
jgi:hypothetical protein